MTTQEAPKVEAPAPVAAPAPAPAPAASAPAPAPAPAATPPAPAPKEGETVTAEEPKAEDTILGAEKPKEVKPEVKGAPEKYSDFTWPEGMTGNKELVEKANAEFKALNLSQEQAQKLVTLQAESAKALTDKALSDYATEIQSWKDSSIKLYGAKSGEEFAVAAQAINRFGTPELRAFLNETGIGNHPELVKFFVQVGHAIKEDNPADGRPVSERKGDAEVFYPGMHKK